MCFLEGWGIWTTAAIKKLSFCLLLFETFLRIYSISGFCFGFVLFFTLPAESRTPNNYYRLNTECHSVPRGRDSILERLFPHLRTDDAKERKLVGPQRERNVQHVLSPETGPYVTFYYQHLRRRQESRWVKWLRQSNRSSTQQGSWHYRRCGRGTRAVESFHERRPFLEVFGDNRAPKLFSLVPATSFFLLIECKIFAVICQRENESPSLFLSFLVVLRLRSLHTRRKFTKWRLRLI